MPKRNTSCCVSILELGQMLEQERYYIVDILLRTAIQCRPSGGITIFAPRVSGSSQISHSLCHPHTHQVHQFEIQMSIFLTFPTS